MARWEQKANPKRYGRKYKTAADRQKEFEKKYTPEDIQEKLKLYVKNEWTALKDTTNINAAYKLLELAALSREKGMDKSYVFDLSSRAKRTLCACILGKGYTEIEDDFDCTGSLMQYDEFCADKGVKTQEIDLLWKILLFEAQNMRFDSYLLYLEHNREKKERFYLPKRRHFIKLGIIQGLQAMLDDELDVLSISMPPGTQKTTCEKFFMSGVVGWFPESYSLFFSHSDDITRMFYDGTLDIVQSGEYCWGEIFPNLDVTATNAKREQFNIGKFKPYYSMQCTSVGAKNAGKVRCNKFLLCDDLIGGIEEALSKNHLDKLWGIYGVDARQRKMDGCKEIHIATRWSVHDVIGRLKSIYGDNERCRFIAVPDIDPETGKSNFDYDYNGLSVEFFESQALLMDDVSYRCLYKNQPIEREGLLFPEEKLRRYTVLPEGVPDEILGQCDTKGRGTDYMAMPVLYRYGEDYYCEDAIFNIDSDYEKQYENLANMIVFHHVQNVEFESNQGGDRVALEVEKRVEEKGWLCNITDTPTESNKEARIFQCSNWVMQHILFKDKSMYTTKSDYGNMISQLTTYSVSGKNPNDDAPDVFSNLAIRKKGIKAVNSISAVKNPFR